jgi:hypothetical protein
MRERDWWWWWWEEEMKEVVVGRFVGVLARF